MIIDQPGPAWDLSHHWAPLKPRFLLLLYISFTNSFFFAMIILFRLRSLLIYGSVRVLILSGIVVDSSERNSGADRVR